MDEPTRKRKPNWIVYDPSAYWADTADLDALDHGIYKLLIDLYYLTGKPLEGTPRQLLRQCRLSYTKATERRAEAILNRFFTSEKAKRTPNGRQMDAVWHHKRCDLELAARATRIEKRRKAAEIRWSGDASASPEPMQVHDALHVTNTNTVYTDTNVSGTPCPEPAPPVRKLVEVIFTDGLAYIMAAGVPERQARSLLGKWRAMVGDEGVIGAIYKAQIDSVSDPVAYITKTLNARSKPHGRRNDKPEQSAFDYFAQRAQDYDADT